MVKEHPCCARCGSAATDLPGAEIVMRSDDGETRAGWLCPHCRGLIAGWAFRPVATRREPEPEPLTRR